MNVLVCCHCFDKGLMNVEEDVYVDDRGIRVSDTRDLKEWNQNACAHENGTLIDEPVIDLSTRYLSDIDILGSTIIVGGNITEDEFDVVEDELEFISDYRTKSFVEQIRRALKCAQSVNMPIVFEE